MPGRFFDANVLIYLVSADAAKADRAESLVAEGGTISVQVLNEIANVARRNMRMSWDQTHILLTSVSGLLTVEPVGVQIHEAGLKIAERYGVSIYDAMILASALNASSNVLWSEDMKHGMVVEERLHIVNPFRNGI